LGKSVVSGCDSAEVLEATEHALDGIAVAVEIGGKAVLPAPICLGRDIRSRAHGFDFAADGVAVVAFVAMQKLGCRHAIEQGVRGNAVCDLSARQQERDRAAEAVGQRVDLRCTAAARAADRLRVLPPFAPAAQR
jgi:hypothetical protein